jgi:hypothetical protein
LGGFLPSLGNNNLSQTLLRTKESSLPNTSVNVTLKTHLELQLKDVLKVMPNERFAVSQSLW